MTRRYFAQPLPPAGGPVELPAAEAAHAFRVMRRRVGDQIELFDGLGNQAEAEVMTLDRRGGICMAEPSRRCVVKTTATLTLATALPTGDRAREMIERLTELNVHRIVPIRFQRTQRPTKEVMLEKLRRVTLEACKQCGRNLLPIIDDERTLTDFLDELPTDEAGRRFVATPGGGTLQAPTGPTLGLIGPEGGLTDHEQLAVADHGFDPVGLGPLILRIETAAATVAALHAMS